ncbi:MAG TPA: hypothetical protein VNE41_06045 [Chitinophagaceae bacterium]|nr:hypothetical protein [Chitinophagaceae bacterium]
MKTITTTCFSMVSGLVSFLLLTANLAYGQMDTTIGSLEALMDTTTPVKSQLVFSAAIGNNPYNQLSKNTYILVNKIYFMPGISYTHKSGLGLAISAYDLFGEGDKGWFEYDISPSYTFDQDKNLSFGISFEKYLYSKVSPIPRSPLNSEFYSYIIVNPWWLQPGLALDYAYGEYQMKKKIIPAEDIEILASLQHVFDFDNLIFANDDLSITPAINLIAGTDKYIRSFGSTRLAGRSKHITKKGKNIPITASTINTYTVQQSQFLARTLEASLDLNYTIGKFTLEPQYYYDFALDPSQGNFSYFLITTSLTF